VIARRCHSALYWRSQRNFLLDVSHGSLARVQVRNRHSGCRAPRALRARGSPMSISILPNLDSSQMVQGSPRIPIFWSVRFVVRFSCPRPQCDGAACQGRLEAKKAGGLWWWPSAYRLFCWKAYTLALTQSGCALHWHASKTAPPDAELGGFPGDIARVDGAAGRGRRDESAARGISRLGERLREVGLWGAGVGGRGGAGPSRPLDPTGVKTNRGIHARPLLNDAMRRAAQPWPDQSSVIYLKES
jgi:hypothetical protein